MVTYLGIAFLLTLVVLVLYGFGFVMRRPPDVSGPDSVQCSICRLRFEKGHLIEREVGDSKLLYFCKSCILNLQHDLETLTK